MIKSEIKTRIITRRKTLIKLMFITLVLGLIYGLFWPKNYYSEAKFVAVVGQNNLDFSKRGLQRISKLAGISLGGDNDHFDMSLLPEVLYSRNVFQHIVHQKVPLNLEGDSIVFIDYFVLGEEAGPENEEDLAPFKMDSIEVISKEYVRTQKSFFKKVSFELDYETNAFTLGTTFDNPYLTVHVTNLILNYLEGYIFRFQLEKKENEILYLKERKKNILEKYEESGSKIASFLTENQDIYHEGVKFEYEKLKNDHNINYAILNEVSSQLELEAFALQENKPIIYLIEKPVINTKHTGLSFKQTILVSIILGLLIGMIALFKKEIERAVVNI